MRRQLPKNVRQIGNVSDSSKIYIEDYVDIFCNQLCDKAERLPIGAFLVGEIVEEDGQDYIYVYGAIRMSTIGIKGKEIYIDDSVWKQACETCKEYFADAEILGWFLTSQGQPLEINYNLTKVHEKYFAKEKSIFIIKDSLDKEEQFYIRKFHDLMECGGHYIYYEKNIEMQNYMIASRKKISITPSEAFEDRATKDFRSVIKEKMDKSEQRNNSRFLYGASTFLVLVVFVIGVTMVNNYDKMRGVQKTLETISESVSNARKEQVAETSGKVITPESENTVEPKTDTVEPDETQSGTTEPDTTEPDATVPEMTENDVQGGAGEQSLEDDIYIVQKGDTLATISKKAYGDINHVEAICKMNGLEDGNLIFIGQKLLLP